jgi:hypothetical protein
MSSSEIEGRKAGGVDTGGALRKGTYISLNAANVLSTVMVNDLAARPIFRGPRWLH